MHNIIEQPLWSSSSNEKNKYFKNLLINIVKYRFKKIQQIIKKNYVSHPTLLSITVQWITFCGIATYVIYFNIELFNFLEAIFQNKRHSNCLPYIVVGILTSAQANLLIQMFYTSKYIWVFYK